MKQKVYISSTFKDLKEERLILRDFFSKQAANDFELVRIMEFMYDDGTSKPSLTTCLEEVRKSDIYLIILGGSAGSVVSEEMPKTYTHYEYEAAMEDAKTKKIYRLMHKGGFDKSAYADDQAKCDAAEKLYNNLLEDVKKGKAPVTGFSSIAEFKNAYMDIFYDLKPTNVANFPEDILKSNIDRNIQLEKFKECQGVDVGKKVRFIHYQSKDGDFAHHLNYRISSLELSAKDWQLGKRFLYDLGTINSTAYDIDAFVEKFIDRIGARMGKPNLRNIEELVTIFEDDPYRKEVVPIEILYSMETREIQFIQRLAHFFNLFVSHSDKMQGEIIFLINIKRNKETAAMDEAALETFRNAIGQLNHHNYLGELNDVKDSDVRNWLENFIDSNTYLANEYFETYFKTDFPAPMDKIVHLSDKLIKDNIKF